MPVDLQEAKQEEKQARDVSSIGRVVRHQAVFEQRTTCYSVAVSGGRFYLSDYNHHVVDVVDAASGARVTRWGAFDQEDRKAAVGGPAVFYNPCGVAVNEKRGWLYVVDGSNHCVVVVRLGDGIVEAVWGGQGSGQQQFNQPSGLAYCPATDQLYVADCLNHCVKVLRGLDGQCVQVLGTGQGDGNTQMNQPLGVAVDEQHVYIADYSNHRVLVYGKQNGEFLFQMGQGLGTGDTQFRCPRDVSVDSEAGVVYVADYNNQRVCVYRTDGSYVRHFQVLQADNSETYPEGVQWDAAAGVLYVTTYGSTISVYPC